MVSRRSARGHWRYLLDHAMIRGAPIAAYELDNFVAVSAAHVD
jgi:hypothetical protein